MLLQLSAQCVVLVLFSHWGLFRPVHFLGSCRASFAVWPLFKKKSCAGFNTSCLSHCTSPPLLFIGSSGRAGVTPRPKALSVRVIAAIWWLFTIALLAAYIANFTALLSSGSEQLPIQTFEDLVKQRKLEFGTLDGSSTFYYFKVQRIWLHTYTRALGLLSWGWGACKSYFWGVVVGNK